MGLAGRRCVTAGCRIAVIAVCVHCPSASAQPRRQTGSSSLTFYADVLPVLEKRCISCHSPGGVGPMSLVSYEDVRTRAEAIGAAVKSRRMPPWLADPNYGQFANDARLTDEEIRLFETWANSGAPAGKPPKQGWSAGRVKSDEVSVDLMLAVPNPIPVPAGGEANYYLIFPLPFTYDRWIRAADIRPGNRTIVDHAVLYVREPGSQWLRNVAPEVPHAVSDAEAEAQEHSATGSIATIYAPGSAGLVRSEEMGMRVPAGADLVLQIRYRNGGGPATDQPQVGLVFADEHPAKRMIRIRMAKDELKIPPGETQFKSSLSGTLTADALLVSLLPCLNPRGGAMEFEIVSPNGTAETLLRIDANKSTLDFNYILRKPRRLPRGTSLRWTGYFGNPASPQGSAQPMGGDRSGRASMVAFLEMAVDSGIDSKTLLAP